MTRPERGDPGEPGTPPGSPSESRSSRRRGPVLVAAAILVVASVLAWQLTAGRPASEPAASPDPSAPASEPSATPDRTAGATGDPTPPPESEVPPSPTPDPASPAPVPDSPTDAGIDDVVTVALPNGTAVVSWTTADVTTGAVRFGSDPETLDRLASTAALDTRHEAMLTGLEPNARYHLRIVAVDPAGGERLHPPRGAPPLDIVATDAGIADTTAADFMTGDARGVDVAGVTDGALELASTVREDYRVAESFPAASGEGTGRVEAYAGQLLVDGATFVDDTQIDAAVASMTARAAFTDTDGQYLGLGTPGTETSAVFRRTDGRLHVTTVTDGSREDTDVGDDSGPHDLAVTWRAGEVAYRLDGEVVATHAAPAPGTLVFVAGDDGGGAPLAVEHLSAGPRVGTGVFTSRVIDAQAMVTWRRASWDADLPAGTELNVEVRTGSRRQPDGTWTGWRRLRDNGDTIGGSSRYLQYRLQLGSEDPSRTPVVRALGFTHDGDIVGQGEGDGTTASTARRSPG